MNILELRTGAKNTIAAAMTDVTVSTHGGEYSLDAIRRYASKAPSVVISILGCDTDKSPLVTFAGLARMSAFVFDRSHANNPRGDSALNLVTLLLRVLATPGQFWGLDGCLSAPQDIRARNLYTPDLDGVGVALWAVSWGQLVDLTNDDEAELDDFDHLHADYNLGPVPDGNVEAEDDVYFNLPRPVYGRFSLLLGGRALVVGGASV